MASYMYQEESGYEEGFEAEYIEALQLAPEAEKQVRAARDRIIEEWTKGG